MSSKFSILFRGQRNTLRAEQKAQLEACRGAVWIHAASVGEFEQARPLIEQLKIHHSQFKIVVTFFSPSGYEARKNYELADGVFYLPFATHLNAKRFIETLQPSMAIFVKYEFWPAYLKALKKRSIPTYCISAIFRPTQRFFHWYGASARRVLKCFTHIYVQDEASRRLLAEHGIHECSVAGDTRFDRVIEIVESQKSKDLSAQSNLTPVAQFTEGAERVLIAGSTWPEDEELLEAYLENTECRIQNTDSGKRVKLILVPHEIDEKHLHFIFNLFQGRMVRYSTINAMPSNMSRLNILRNAQVMVIDTMGLLSSIYRFGQVAYIGGGFGVGIHNTIEAAVYGVPVVFGPNYHHFREAQGLIDAGAARSIKNYSELEAALNTTLDQHETIGAKAAEYVQSELGATEKIYKGIF
ncbi:MAG: 3-deoxy-D-manno-octulosonic acid transferase [Paludibacteraceae bacterium]|nr:3-deoxy-D-manno-octulosonic acid transferase [Paludibacteraceae bacterium]